MVKRPRKPNRLEQFKATYFAECQERQADIERVLADIREGGGDRKLFDELFRAVHSVKGGGGAFGFEDIVSLAHSFETVLDALRRGALALDDSVSEVLVVAADALAASIESTQEGRPADAGNSEARALLDALINADEAAEPAPQPPSQPQPQNGERRSWHIRFSPHGDLFRSANDPLLIVRELHARAAG
ncbi:MAG: Hpt domain-containing protein [Alphaproteobacteria bacterium]|jgi:two-component system chemotaxis sensor kinase CheA|nr:Hpt domain-containing protein [Alphaproteobacteria bacterium]